MKREVDAVVIGTGSAGASAANALRKAGRSVAIVDERPFGGTCALRGCDPKKVLVAAAGAVDAALRYERLGIVDRVPQLDWAALARFKRTFTDPVPEQRAKAFAEAGILALHGHARFVDPQTIAVNGDAFRAKHVVVAAGAAPAHVAEGDDCLLTSDDFLDLERLPPSLLFVGGGYIAFEFAHVAARAGARVTIVHNGAEPLGGFDRDAVARLLDATARAGIEVVLDAPVERVERSEGGITVHARGKDGPRVFQAATGVLSAGRAPNIDGLDLAAGGIERTKNGVKVSDYLQSVSNPRVYAAGDCADGGGLPLTPVAGREGETAAANIIDGNAHAIDFRGLVSMVYAIPALGQAGIGESRAKEQGRAVDVHAGDMSDWYSTRHVAAQTAYYKVVTDRGDGTILGATILGPHAQEQINVLALAIRERLPARAVMQALFGYPTGSSDLTYLF